MENELFIQKQWAEVRNIRHRLLVETDWTQVSDAPLNEAKRAEFNAYRAALRDLPQSFESPEQVVWPTKPEL
ncbi:phage tail assembly chaperone [Pseudoalteromonas sp. SCSIO 43201]|uniref:tail fiber assembly protein n=1 Tax=Pseudoalteromonas TaxID=53246 RepID=UPI002075689C|nr:MULTISPECIES: tail fiber assembly protein [Pseudoalteromonas]MDW7550183.1 tail fiber assembly protein [Pseudoalteromonas peptidolytica]USD29485.1 phage tail assembly chaperone [Pseudoalteromonas sp. SCSIO 43201]